MQWPQTPDWGYPYPGGCTPRLPVNQAQVTFTHGYPALPDAVVWIAKRTAGSGARRKEYPVEFYRLKLRVSGLAVMPGPDG